eukprot:CAMPEP_0170147182 /NCGR_PEP_ID=MMETSP0033_2-20121228/33431_1 /TAXON_ID=195969 /ORGANISM="Dolichomastix tenuilepis, Strain CCMP3274" /LENGTH=355 /DNA_ID=CAMNT_0010383969 /DNA_START=50 /DNA_END=1114 /DNA_ORIENTATION=+
MTAFVDTEEREGVIRIKCLEQPASIAQRITRTRDGTSNVNYSPLGSPCNTAAVSGKEYGELRVDPCAGPSAEALLYWYCCEQSDGTCGPGNCYRSPMTASPENTVSTLSMPASWCVTPQITAEVTHDVVDGAEVAFVTLSAAPERPFCEARLRVHNRASRQLMLDESSQLVEQRPSNDFECCGEGEWGLFEYTASCKGSWADALEVRGEFSIRNPVTFAPPAPPESSDGLDKAALIGYCAGGGGFILMIFFWRVVYRRIFGSSEDTNISSDRERSLRAKLWKKEQKRKAQKEVKAAALSVQAAVKLKNIIGAKRKDGEGAEGSGGGGEGGGEGSSSGSGTGLALKAFSLGGAAKG